MKIQTGFAKTIFWLALGLSLVGGISISTSAASAQSVDPLDDNQNRTEDPFSNNNSNQYSPFFNMMHRVQLGTIRSISEYGQDQQEQIGTEAQDFRTRQMQMIQQNGQAPTGTMTPTAPVQTTPVQTMPAQPNQ